MPAPTETGGRSREDAEARQINQQQRVGGLEALSLGWDYFSLFAEASRYHTRVRCCLKKNSSLLFLFSEKLSIYSSSIMTVQRIPEIKITSRFVNHLATTTSTEASRRRAAVIAPLSPEPGTTCCSRQSKSRRCFNLYSRVCMRACNIFLPHVS